MGRKIELAILNNDLLNGTSALRVIRRQDVKARKSKLLARLKPKFTADIAKLDLLIDTLVAARKLVKVIPKAVQ